MSLKKEIIAKREEFAEYKKNTYTEKNLKLILEEMFTKYKLDILVFRGYTPGFNDGDPCEHSTDWFDDEEMFYYIDGAEDGDFDDYEDHSYKFDFANLEKVNEYVNAMSYGTEERNEFNTYGSVIVDIMDELQGTDYKYIIYVNKEDQIIIEHEEYYCGY